MAGIIPGATHQPMSELAATYQPECERRRLPLPVSAGSDAEQGASFDLKQLRRFTPELQEFFVLGPVFLHPRHRLVVPLAGLVFVPQLPMGHGQEEPIEAVTPARSSADLSNVARAFFQSPAR